MVILLISAAAVYALLGERRDAMVMAAALLPILAVDLLLEGRAERTLESLRRLTEPTALVLRDAAWTSIRVELLVPGDIIRVQEGDVLPADCRLIAGSDITADESALTGESVPVPKAPGDGNDRLLAGTVVLGGRGVAEVLATGQATEYGKIGALTASVEHTATPLQESMGRLMRRLFVGALALCLAVVTLGLARGLGARESLIGGVSLAIAAIPEEFPVVYALYLTLGVWRLASHKALIRRMVGVETLGSTTVICTDKTGTLTLGRMELTDTWTPGGSQADKAALLRGAALACEPNPYDPLEQAILARAPQPSDGWALVHEYAFDADRKYMSHVWQTPDGDLQLYAKGALESLLRRCNVGEAEARAVEDANRGLAERGIRLLAVAARSLQAVTGDRERDESGLELLGLVGLSDPVRPEIPDAVRECRAAGIRVVMVTGDHPATARAAARQAGVAVDGVFARVSPSQKLELVKALKSAGETVAMTGDGINDGPALRAADIGVAMGIRGTNVAREAATMVLLDDNFGTIVAAVREGRRILANVRRAFAYLVAFHVPILLSAVAAPLLGVPLLLQPAHLVWLELVIHPTASLVFEGDEPDPETMRRPPPPRGGALLGTERLVCSLLEGMGLFGAVWGAYAFALGHGWPEAAARNVAFTSLVLGQIGLVLVERGEGRPWSAGLRGNRLLPAILALTAASTALPYAPPVADALHLAPLSPSEWLAALLLSLAATLWAELVQLARQWRFNSP